MTLGRSTLPHDVAVLVRTSSFGELPQASPCGISPIMYIPQESRHFPALLAFVNRKETSDELVHVKRKQDARISC